jgi:hypothetical protein
MRRSAPDFCAVFIVHCRPGLPKDVKDKRFKRFIGVNEIIRAGFLADREIISFNNGPVGADNSCILWPPNGYEFMQASPECGDFIHFEIAHIATEMGDRYALHEFFGKNWYPDNAIAVPALCS